MRYRPLGPAEPSVSAITLAPPPGTLTEAQACHLLCAALEHGINSFQISAGDAAAAAAVGQLVASVGRRLLTITLAVAADGTDPAPVRAALQASRAERFDIVLVDGSAPDRLAERAERLRREGLARRVALAGDGTTLDCAIADGGLDAVAVSYNLRTGWPERNRVKAAAAKGLSVIGYDFEIMAGEAARAPEFKGLARLIRRQAVQETKDAYGFLQWTSGWTSAQICLAYALSEPALATVQVRTAAPDEVRQLAEAVERDLPSGVAAQIEIARFAALPAPAGTEARLDLRGRRA